MIAGYKNCLMMQFHPEKTPDGLKMIENWLGFSPKKLNKGPPRE